ncbi:uncharacterized protein I303_102271 [Kwoniella dejecticola CBS 10117]|uniref:Uncharacterized protein n=1 Tax=Kwoniella dejecticola CBS 10117 TaxID=1296121 RepID=A0A1A6ABF2_9TREE|nr:uncharacterized protein I303_01589 [Kwoniella dejecticola CBS 10117]OBR87387.1 hypothetical protein I303_01589 [Kwoniella dejecticola CBS 10117]
MASTGPAYVSSSGTLGSLPLTSRISNQASNYVTLAYLFVETLLSPIINPASWQDPSVRPPPRSSNHRGNGNGGDGGGRGGGSGGSGGHGRGNGGGGGAGGRGTGGGGGFMSMGDLRGGGTVDGCRATCG